MGDFPGALATADAMPDLRRQDFPGPTDGFYDAIRPATLALIAECAADAGNATTAKQAFDRSIEFCRAVKTDSEKIIAQIVISQTLAGSGKIDLAGTMLAEAIPLALRQPEPRRSRCLVMLVESQVQARNMVGAAETAEAIRAYPGQEKVRALNILARSYEEAGDHSASKTFLRKALECNEAQEPANVTLGPVNRLSVIGAHDFIDPDLEFEKGMTEFSRKTMSISLRVRLGDTDEALRLVHSQPGPGRDFALSTLISTLAFQGKLVEALRLASTIQKPEERLSAIQVACSVIQPHTGSRRAF